MGSLPFDDSSAPAERIRSVRNTFPTPQKVTEQTNALCDARSPIGDGYAVTPCRIVGPVIGVERHVACVVISDGCTGL